MEGVVTVRRCRSLCMAVNPQRTSPLRPYVAGTPLESDHETGRPCPGPLFFRPLRGWLTTARGRRMTSCVEGVPATCPRSPLGEGGCPRVTHSGPAEGIRKSKANLALLRATAGQDRRRVRRSGFAQAEAFFETNASHRMHSDTRTELTCAPLPPFPKNSFQTLKIML